MAYVTRLLLQHQLVINGHSVVISNFVSSSSERWGGLSNRIREALFLLLHEEGRASLHLSG